MISFRSECVPDCDVRALEQLPTVLGPIVEGIREMLGVYSMVVFGGPEPQKGGQKNMF